MMKGLKRELLRAGREKKGVHWYCIECSQDVERHFQEHAGAESQDGGIGGRDEQIHQDRRHDCGSKKG